MESELLQHTKCCTATGLRRHRIESLSGLNENLRHGLKNGGVWLECCLVFTVLFTQAKGQWQIFTQPPSLVRHSQFWRRGLADAHAGTFSPSQFKKNAATGVYEAAYTLNGMHAATALNMPQHHLYCATNGVTGIKNGRVWGGNAMTALSIGTSNADGDFEPFAATGASAAALTESGHVIRGHFAGNDDGMISPADIQFDTTRGPWLDEEAATSMSKYKKTSAEIAAETFGSHPSVQVDGTQYAMLPPTSSVGTIISTYGKDPKFYGGVYSKGHHMVDGNMLVPRNHYDELHGPLLTASRSTESDMVFKVSAGKQPTAPVMYSMQLQHRPPQHSDTSAALVATNDEERKDAVRAALAKMKLAATGAKVEFEAPAVLEDDADE